MLLTSANDAPVGMRASRCEEEPAAMDGVFVGTHLTVRRGEADSIRAPRDDTLIEVALRLRIKSIPSGSKT